MPRERVRSGVDYRLEAEANRLLANGRREQPSRRIRDRTDYLSPGQLARRQSREVLNRNGVADSRIMRGMFKRAYNPALGKKPVGLRSRESE